MEAMSPGGEWTVTGFVTVFETGIADPLSVEYKDLVRPRACAMGGEALTLTTAANQAAIGSGSGTIYTVLRRTSLAKPTAEPF